jgi:hypothetical protein
LGLFSALDCEGRTIWIVDAHRGDRKRFIVRADEKLTAFVELERQGVNRDVLSCVHSCRTPGRTAVNVHRGDGKRFVVRADEMLTAFVELQRAIHEFAVDLIS